MADGKFEELVKAVGPLPTTALASAESPPKAPAPLRDAREVAHEIALYREPRSEEQIIECIATALEADREARQPVYGTKELRADNALYSRLRELLDEGASLGEGSLFPMKDFVPAIREWARRVREVVKPSEKETE